MSEANRSAESKDPYTKKLSGEGATFCDFWVPRRGMCDCGEFRSV